MKNELKEVTRWWGPVPGRDGSGVCGCWPEREEGTQTGTVLTSEGRLLLVKWKHSFLLSKCCPWKNKQTNELTNQPSQGTKGSSSTRLGFFEGIVLAGLGF